ncbi:uncharacterized protein TRIADDRAFT_59135 [Trichoplax adhaerens]|uniref:VPS37 C-terminal domain-containing protein n=1 Tax=Trichoplax adhaerens TaxID=10228 RepID=B3S4M0_TRIAD|nr:hypothetical protein TRIADDRAFT_59135 [Trichoplax adhaerens]EDV22655.1 hypothetical protein TRIADDRAFT_59135 [Trichoplax adhaerens]|eukprot:XP_002115199.1 hypothetical protein TRIADDRAFT_59135 [Trichoplax adhaerens]
MSSPYAYLKPSLHELEEDCERNILPSKTAIDLTYAAFAMYSGNTGSANHHPPSYPGYPPAQSDVHAMPMPVIPQSHYSSTRLNNPPIDVSSDISTFLGILRGKTSDDLQTLLHNESKIISMIGESDQVRKMKSTIQTSTARNQSLADYNLKRKPDLESRINSLKQVLEKYKTLRDEYAQKVQLLGNYRIDLDTISALMKASVAQNEEEAETLADEFMDRKISVENFVNEFLEKRKEAHLRIAKSENLINIISQSGSQANWKMIMAFSIKYT